jgi:hypothetical protein
VTASETVTVVAAGTVPSPVTGRAWYCTREDVRSALDAESAARTDAQVDRAIDSASRAVEALCQRDFAPVTGTRFFDWPSQQTSRSWRVWLDRNEIITASLVISGDVTIPATDYFLEPANSGPPFNRVEVRLDRPSGWQAGSTQQRAIAITGLFGYSDTQEPAGALAAGIDAATTAVTVTDSSVLGVGDLLTVGGERMTVTGKRLTGTGQTVQTPLTAKNNDNVVAVSDGTVFHEGEIVTVGAEQMEIRAITGNTLIVKRAVAGSVLAAHTGTGIYVPRLLTVARAAAGSTASTASSGTAVTRWTPPGPVHTLTVAEALNTLLQEQAGYLRTAGGSSGSGGKEATLDALNGMRAQVVSTHGRQARIRVV